MVLALLKPKTNQNNTKYHVTQSSFQATCIVLIFHSKEVLCLKRSLKKGGTAAVYLHSWIR